MSMFSCPTCLHRAIRNFATEQPGLPSLLPRSLTQAQSSRKSPGGQISKRHHATYDSLVRGHHRRILRKTLSQKTLPPPNARRKGAGSLTKGEIKDALARENNRNILLNKDGPSKSPMTPERRQQIQLKKDIEQYYADPLQLANAVMLKLRVPDYNGALALVRASEGIVSKNIVSWNHCIDWSMSQGDSDQAWRLFNELKKRGNKPDSYTYTIMLRGLSQNSRQKGSAQRAVGIYNSMFAPNSAVVPNTIHTNAVLNVCARSKDMESLWAIAGRLPERGAGAPDRWTFTTILNAIKENATSRVAELLRDPGKLKEDDQREGGQGMTLEERQKVIFDEALRDGRKLWADISFRWRRADLVVDEQLVCAMGRLILGCGTSKDFPEVFDLVDQVMNIKLAERGHKKGAAAETKGVKEEEIEDDIDEIRPSEMPDTALAMAKVEKASLPLSEEQVYATPGNHTLSMIIEAAIGAKDSKLGRAYWHYLTTPNGPHKIAPDAITIISYLRLLRINRASSDALNILSREWPTEVAEKLYRRGTFVIAMSTCIRDKNNPNVFETAESLMKLMQEKLEEARVGMYDKIEATEHDPNLTYKERRAAAKARMNKGSDETFGEDEALAEIQRTKSGVESSLIDPKALRMYLDLALLKTPGWNEGIIEKPGSDETFERDPKNNLTLRALRRLGPATTNISRLAKMKLLEAEVSSRPLPPELERNLSRNAQRRAHDRAGTRVAEKLEDMMDLLRTLVSAYDRVIVIAERFEDEDRTPLDKNLISNYRDLKRTISAFLTRTKDEVIKITRGSLKYAKWRHKPTSEFDEDDNTDEPQASNSDSRNEVPKIGREIKRIYEDTDRSIGRLQQRSRRQRLERSQGVKERMQRRLGTGEDPGMLDEELRLGKKREVEDRMRQRAFGISVGGRENPPNRFYSPALFSS